MQVSFNLWETDPIWADRDARMAVVRTSTNTPPVVALDGKLITHEQQYKARSILYYEQLKQVPPVFSEGSMTWRSRADAPPGTPIPETLLPGAQRHLLISSGSRRSPSTVRRMLRQDE